jgi:hypothetical protein
LAALTGVCRRVRELGAERPFLLATGMGTGEVPDPEEAEWCVVEVRAPDVVAEIRAAMRMLPADRGGRAARTGRLPGRLHRRRVLAAEGFLPTELNPRFGAGLATMTRDLPDLPVSLLDRALVEGEPLAFAAGDLERQVLAVADRVRAGGAWTVTKEPADATRELAVAFEGGACRPAPAGRTPDGVLSFGPSGVGGFVRLALDPDRVPAGPPVAPLAVAAFALADERFGTGIGRLEPARAVR